MGECLCPHKWGDQVGSGDDDNSMVVARATNYLSASRDAIKGTCDEFVRCESLTIAGEGIRINQSTTGRISRNH